MNWFPQTSAGAVSQFPVTRTRQWRVISNDLESGERIALADTYSNSVSWQLTFQDLSDAEASRMSGLFTQSQGRALSFGFVDPLANLLAWSEDLSRPDWQAGPLVAGSGISDPLGGHGAWSLTNASTGTLTLQQTLGLPGEYTACFSVWLMASAKTTVTLNRDGIQKQVPVGTAWTRVQMSGTGVAGAATSTFAVSLAAGVLISMFGPQVEAQPNPSAYKKTVAARGIYPTTWFADDQFTTTSVAPGRTNIQIRLISKV